MRRHFLIHVGGTNTGKTYAGFQKLIRAGTGVYLGPLRLLAREAQDYLLGAVRTYHRRRGGSAPHRHPCGRHRRKAQFGRLV